MVHGLGAALASDGLHCTRCGADGKTVNIVAYCIERNLCGMTLAAVNLCSACFTAAAEPIECGDKEKYASISGLPHGEFCQLHWNELSNKLGWRPE